MSSAGRTEGYLLDLNVLRAWQNPAHADHQKVAARITALGSEPPLFISAVTLGEIEYGHRLKDADDPQRNAIFSAFIDQQFPQALEVRRSTTQCYGQIRALLFDRFAPRDSSGKRHRGLRVAQLTEPMSDQALGVDENDVWSAAHAVEYNLVLVTHDRMQHLRDVTGGLLQVEDWRV